MKIRPVGAELFHADRRTDMMKLIVVFRDFANAPKKKRDPDDQVPVIQGKSEPSNNLVILTICRKLNPIYQATRLCFT